jgi:TonB family protein
VRVLFTVSFLLFFILSCTGVKYQKAEKSHGESDRLNYSYTNDYLKHTVQRDHFLLAITVDSPMLIDFGKAPVDPVHIRAAARGNTVLKVRVSSSGQVQTVQVVKRAGVGLDEYAEKIVRSSKFVPVRHRGKDQNSSFLVNVEFKEL